MLQGGFMRAAVPHQARSPLPFEETPVPSPGPGQLRIKVEACALCRTDLHIIDGELASPKLSLILGHEIVGKVNALGEEVRDFSVGERVGVPWLGQTCGHCSYCLSVERTSVRTQSSQAIRGMAVLPNSSLRTPAMCSTCRPTRIRLRRHH